MISSSAVRTKVFICYSHADTDSLQRLRVHLAPYVRNKQIDIWDDTKIRPGASWKEEIDQAIKTAKVAVLLVSADFLASDFIAQDELPPLLSAAKSEGVTILPVLLRACGYQDTPLADFQFVNKPLLPLRKLGEDEREEAWTGVALAIKEALAIPLPATVSISSPQQDIMEHPQGASVDTWPQQLSSDTVKERYYQALLADQSITQLQVLTMSSPLPISDIYVRLQVHENVRRPSSDRIGWRETRDPQSLAQQQVKLLEARFRTALEPAEAVQKYPHCIIVGDPGAGKTTLLKYLTIQAAKQRFANLPTVPVYVRLNAFASSDENDLLRFAARTWEREYQIPAADAYTYIGEQMAAGNVLLLLDALDEAAIGDALEKAEVSYKHVADEIIRLARFCSWIVVTARKAGYQQRAKLHAFTELDLLDFRQQEIEQFIESWFASHPREELRGYAPRLIQDLQKNPRIQTLAANPLLLTLITLVYEDEMELSERRSTLYKKCVDMLLTRWDVSRSIPRFRAFSPNYQKQLLCEISWHFHQQGLRYFPEEKLLSIIADFLSRIGMDEQQAYDVLLAISGDTGLLREQADGLYGFFHLTLQEFFASQRVDTASSLLAHLDDPWWEEVILLYVGEAHDATPLLEHLLIPDGPGEVPEDLFSSKLLLAGYCLAARPTVSKVELWKEVPDRLFKILLHSEYALTRQQVAEALAEIGRAYPRRDINRRLLALLMSNKQRISVRMSIATALSICGAHELVSDLLEFLVKTPMDEQLRESISAAIAKLVDRTLLPRLMMLVSDKNTDPLVIMSIADCLGDVGDTTTAGSLLSLFSEYEKEPGVQAALAYNAARLADGATVASLIKLAADPSIDASVTASVPIALALAKNCSVAFELIPLLRKQHINLLVRIGIAFALNVVTADSSVADQLFPLLSDHTLEEEVRRWCARAFAMHGLHTQRVKVLELLADANSDELIRIDIVWALMESGDRSLLADLRSIRAQERNQRLRTLITIALGLLGDATVQPQFSELFLNGAIPESFYSRATDIVVLNLPARSLVEKLTDTGVKREIRVALAQALGATDLSSLVPDLLKVLEDTVVIEEVRESVAEAIGSLGDGKETVERLLKIWRFYALRDPQRISSLVDTIYRALWTVSRRTGVLIVAKGAEYQLVER